MKVVPTKTLSADMTSLGFLKHFEDRIEEEMRCGFYIQKFRSTEYLEKAPLVIPKWMVGVNSGFRVK